MMIGQMSFLSHRGRLVGLGHKVGVHRSEKYENPNLMSGNSSQKAEIKGKNI